MGKVKEISAAVLAGGKSTRFGKDKRFFKIGDKTFVEIMCEKVKNVFDFCYLSVEKNFDRLQIPEIEIISQFKVVYDRYDGIGPIGGVISVLCEVINKGCVFVPVDMPFLDEKILIYLSQIRDFDIAYFNLNGKVYPIPGYYSKNLISFIEEMISKGNFSLKTLIEGWGGKKLEISFSEIEKLGIGPESMLNVNEMKDLISIFKI
ncbi:molybdopterin-guanine dinucleotide biosynthesis protein A [Candidatus Thermokryptus mobilis]|uniref:Molybdopterin-guanine dinucleotide biosynthesis protein A n=1 Tax=Candidatus Thermokryptus mobilis TaxID=1643428 RepID=A0A0S4N100_9BACT|nr:molybdenum cofactor guanylyltransferase [Candidatus Thermokryptus mobilis]CUU04688.1 molybdopterin-guanine dinucleotide biosynthesis protein A [Candidatus Thermokryptus mobilis]